jgi:hypothetical protein
MMLNVERRMRPRSMISSSIRIRLSPRLGSDTFALFVLRPFKPKSGSASWVRVCLPLNRDLRFARPRLSNRQHTRVSLTTLLRQYLTIRTHSTRMVPHLHSSSTTPAKSSHYTQALSGALVAGSWGDKQPVKQPNGSTLLDWSEGIRKWGKHTGGGECGLALVLVLGVG